MIINDIYVLIGVGVFVIQFIILFMILTKTPGGIFLKAMIKRQKILIHPTEDKYMTFIAVKPGPLSLIKNRGFFSVYPNDVYTERTSRIPMAIVYGNTGLTLDPKMVGLSDRLKMMGLKTWEQVAKFADILKEKGQEFTILGESINPANAVDYFNMNMRSDLTEAEIQRRTAAQMALAKKNQKDLMLYAIILVVIFIGGAIAWQIVGSTNAGAASSGAQAVGTATKIVTANATGVLI